MKYNRLGSCGLKVSELSFGSWLTFGSDSDRREIKRMLRTAFDRGVNFFDTAEVYGRGTAEEVMGEALREFRREDLVVATKIYFGGNGPNDKGLSWKHIVEGTKNSLRRLKMEYVDVLFCHRPDEETPVEETVRAVDHVIRRGMAFYWGTSEWPAEQIERAFAAAEALGCVPPVVEQPQYNLFHRSRVEEEYRPLFERYGIGTTIWSPLASGVLTGKYNQGTPSGSRLATHEWLQGELTEERLSKVSRLNEISDELGCKLAQLAIAWCLSNPRVSTVILGSSRMSQLEENLKAADAKDLLTEEVLRRIEAVVTD